LENINQLICQIFKFQNYEKIYMNIFLLKAAMTAMTFRLIQATAPSSTDARTVTNSHSNAAQAPDSIQTSTCATTSSRFRHAMRAKRMVTHQVPPPRTHLAQPVPRLAQIQLVLVLAQAELPMPVEHQQPAVPVALLMQVEPRQPAALLMLAMLQLVLLTPLPLQTQLQQLKVLLYNFKNMFTL
jgi:hypothetical protein